MLEIKCNPGTMSQEEREDLASFILGYPARTKSTLTDKITLGVDFDTKAAHAKLSELEEHAKLASEQKSDMREGFDPNPSPLPLGATAAPCSAGVDLLGIAQEVMPVITSSDQNINANGQNAATSASEGVIVAHQTNTLVQLDSEGLPWNERIHTSARTKIANGTWKLKRGITPDLVEIVKEELRALMAVPSKGIAFPGEATPPVLKVVQGYQVIATGNPPTGVVVPADPHSPINNGMTPPPPPTIDSPVILIRTGFVDFMQDITEQMSAGKLTMGEILAACVGVGVSAPNLLATRPDLVPAVAATITQTIASKS